MSGLYDEDGIDGPFDRAMNRAMKDDSKAGVAPKQPPFMTSDQRAKVESDARAIVEDLADCPSLTPQEKDALRIVLLRLTVLEVENGQLLRALQREAR